MSRRPATGPDRTLVDFDWVLVGLIALIATLGVLEIYSATLATRWQDAYSRQLIWLGLGAVMFWVMSSIDYHWLVDQAAVFYGVAVALLLGILLFTDPINGSRRWIPLPGGLSLQVSEFVKVVLVLVVARFFSNFALRRIRFRDVLRGVAIFAVPVLLVRSQPDLSTALSYTPLLGIGVFLSGLRWKHAAAAALAAVLVVPVGWWMLKPYQQERIITFMNPENDPRGAGYQPLQAKIAVGAGGIWGQGFARGTQTQLRFLPVPHTDFVFAAFAEESGFVGVLFAMALYFALLMRIVHNAQAASDASGMLITMSVAALLLFQLLVNVGMVANKMPVAGIPLPLMSYGGSNTLAVLMLLGLVNNVRLRRFAN